MGALNINKFISEYVIQRPESMFKEDLLNYEIELTDNISGRSVLVIGGAGTIGSSFIRALLPFKPKSLVVVDINENGLAELTRDLRSEPERYIPEEYITYPLSYADHIFEKIFRLHKGFDIVANFSAHKHVRSEKDKYSVEALIENNVIRARRLLYLLEEFPPQHYFCVSTDKAANPVNIMGASKKMMESMIMSYADKFPVTTARFANVAFSNGSLPAGFLERISKQQPLSAPKDVTRYFVSPEESGHICLLACILGKSGEVYFPKLQEAQTMTFSSIASNLLHYIGYDVLECKSEIEALSQVEELRNGSKKYPVFFSESNTSGEKLYEEFYTQTEQVDMGKYISLGVITNMERKTIQEIDKMIESFTFVFQNPDFTKENVVSAIGLFLGKFDHIETGKSLDTKM